MYKINVYGNVTFDPSNSTLKFDSENSEFASIGMSIVEEVLVKKCDVAIINTKKFSQINLPYKTSLQHNSEKITENRSLNYLFSNSGDAKFRQMLEGLNDYHKKVGLELITKIRNFNSRGKLKYCERSKIFVEQPDNFWAIHIHSQSESFSITIRRKSIKQNRKTTLELREDRPSYVRFSVSCLEQVPDAIMLIKEAKWNH